MKNKKNLYYPIIIVIAIIFTFITWMNEANIHIKDLGEFIIYFDINELWHYLTFNNNKLFLIIFPILLLYNIVKDNSKYKNIWLKNIFIIAIYIIVMYIICNILSINLSSLNIYLVGIGNVNPLIFVLITIVISILLSSFIINIGLIVKKYFKNIYFNIIISYVIIVFIEVISSNFIGPLMAKLLPFYEVANSFNLFNMISLNSNAIIIIIYSIVLAVGSYIVLIWLDKSNE